MTLPLVMDRSSTRASATACSSEVRTTPPTEPWMGPRCAAVATATTNTSKRLATARKDIPNPNDLDCRRICRAQGQGTLRTLDHALRRFSPALLTEMSKKSFSCTSHPACQGEYFPRNGQLCLQTFLWVVSSSHRFFY